MNRQQRGPTRRCHCSGCQWQQAETELLKPDRISPAAVHTLPRPSTSASEELHSIATSALADTKATNVISSINQLTFDSQRFGFNERDCSCNWIARHVLRKHFIMLNFAKLGLLRSVSFGFQSPNDSQTQNFLSRYKMSEEEGTA